jgi:4-amino-4-deoxy-L-arabinose transferase-like glycosyltransferase
VVMYDWLPQPEEETGPPPRSRWQIIFLLLLCAAWILPGLIGHDPWKPDEAYTFGMVYHILQSGDWIVPTLAGEPFMEKPPLYYLTAAAFAKLFSPILPLHDGARLASGFYMALTLMFTGFAGRELYGQGKGFPAALILVGCIGLLVFSHFLITDTALLAGFAIAYYGLALVLHQPLAGGIWLGIGIGIGFLSKGLLAPGVLGITALTLPILCSKWRNRTYAIGLISALLTALPFLIIWPFALYQRSPALFMDWFWLNNFGRFLGFAHLGPEALPYEYFAILPWFAWPALPLALWTLWHERHEICKQPPLHLPLISFFTLLWILGLASDEREIYALPMLLPLSLLAARGFDTLRRGAANALSWFGGMVFMFFAGVLWFYWFAAEFEIPAKLGAHLRNLQPGYTPVAFHGFAFTIALLLTGAWLILLVRLKRSAERPIIIWAAGMALVWGLLMSLFMPWLDAGKSYRSMISSMQQALPTHYSCIASRDLGEPQRALLDYFAGIRTEREDENACDLLLVQHAKDEVEEKISPSWHKIWEGSRPGDKQERYRLYKRVGEQSKHKKKRR